MSEEPPVHVTITSMYGIRTQRGLVTLRVGSSEVTVSPAQAREFAVQLIECAEAAISDAGLVAFLQDYADLPINEAAQVLQMFRGFRIAEAETHGAEPSDFLPPEGQVKA